MSRIAALAIATLIAALALAGIPAQAGVAAVSGQITDATEGPPQDPFRYVVFHALDRDGFCDVSLVPGAVSLHPVLGLPVDFIIESGDGAIIETSNGGGIPANPRAVEGVLTFSTGRNAMAANPIKEFPPAVAGVEDECQAWIKVHQSIPGPLRILVVLHGQEGDLIWVADLGSPPGPPVGGGGEGAGGTVSLVYRWTLITWIGADSVSVGDALAGTGAAAGGTNVTSDVSAVYGWNAGEQDFDAYFPSGVGVPGANDLAFLHTGQAYWVAIKGPGPVSWTIAP